MLDLLSPVGDFDCLKAAVQNGADSVYFGADLFSARAFASNFDDDTLAKAINYAKIRGVKTNLTLNIYSNCIDENEKETYSNAIKNYFTLKLNDVTREIKRTVFTGILFSIVGIIVLALMFLLSNLEAKAIWIECVNIFAWVFLWEAVDKLFIERNKLLLKISRLSSFINMKINYYNK